MTPDPSLLPALVVDDDEPTQKLLQALLRRAGFESEVASNGREAIRRLETKAYAVVILDMMMPSVGGREVLAFLATASIRVPVVICSAAGPAVLTDFDGTIVKAVVRKPFDVDEFTAAVTGAVNGNHGDGR